MSEIMSKGPSIFSLISELITSAVAEHMWMNWKLQPCGLTGPLDHPQKPCCGDRSSAFSNEDVGTIAL
jgi:hypothetical protein